MPQPVAVDRVADPLVSAYRTAWERILVEQERLADDPVRWVRRRRLEEMSRSVAAVMDDLDGETAKWVSDRFPRAYLLGLTDATGATAAEVGWSAIHQEAVEELAYRVYDDLLGATRHVRDSTKALVRTLGREFGTTALIRGDTAQGAGRAIAKVLAERGIAAITYKNGARHGLASYSEMLMRTSTAIGYNVGTLNATPDIKYYECFDGPNCGLTFHEDSTQANGLILERDEALAYPIAHPNCRRAWGARPDVTQRSDIPRLEANPLTVGAGNTTLGQRAAQIAQDRQRGTRSPRGRRHDTLNDPAALEARSIVSKEGHAIDAFDGKEYPVTKFPTAKQADGTYARGSVTRENLPAWREARKIERDAAKAAGRPLPLERSRPPRTPRNTSPTPTAPVASAAKGRPASSAVTGVPPRSDTGKAISHSLAQIEKVHRIPDGIPSVPVTVRNTDRGSYGSYAFRRDGPDKISIRATGDHRSGTFAHEFGHYLDHTGDLVGQQARIAAQSASRLEDRFGNPITRYHFGSSPVGREDPLMRSLYEAILDSPSFKALGSKTLRDGTPILNAHLTHASYYVRADEAWARAYHQWIATRSGDRGMLDEIGVIIDEPSVRSLSQWPADEFAPIAAAMDEIFRARGLLVD